MSKVEVYCKIRKKNVKMDKKLADALVKMKRASYDTKEETVYPDKMMVAKPVEEPKNIKQVETSPKKRRPRKKKDEIDSKLQQEIDALDTLKNDIASD